MWICQLIWLFWFRWFPGGRRKRPSWFQITAASHHRVCVCVSWWRVRRRTGHTWAEEFEVWFPWIAMCCWGLTIHGPRSPFPDWQELEPSGSGSPQGHPRMEFPSTSCPSIFCLSQGSWTEKRKWELVVLFFLPSHPTLWLLTHSLFIHSFNNFFSIHHIPGMVLSTAEQKRKLYVEFLLFSHSVVSDSFATPWTVACQAPLSMGFPREEYWSGLPFPPPGDLPSPGTEPRVSSICWWILYHGVIREALHGQLRMDMFTAGKWSSSFPSFIVGQKFGCIPWSRRHTQTAIC